jgi:hypothetical protein
VVFVEAAVEVGDGSGSLVAVGTCSSRKRTVASHGSRVTISTGTSEAAAAGSLVAPVTTDDFVDDRVACVHILRELVVPSVRLIYDKPNSKLSVMGTIARENTKRASGGTQ